MPLPNLDSSFALGKRLSGMEDRLRAVETKQFPLAADTNWNSAEGFAVPASVTTVVSCTLVVPAHCTTAIVMGNAELFFLCQPATATGDWGSAGMEITASTGAQNSSGAGSIWGTATGSGAATLPVPQVAQFPSCSAFFTGLTMGSTITATAQVWSTLGWSSNVNNLAMVRATAIYFP